MSETVKQRTDYVYRKEGIHLHMTRRILRHPGEQRLVGVLHEGDAAAPFDGEKARAPIVQRPAQDHSYYPGTVGNCGAAEQGIDRWPVAVLVRSATQAELPAKRLKPYA